MEASNTDFDILRRPWTPGAPAAKGLRQVSCDDHIVALAGGADLSPEQNLRVAEMISAAPDLRAACQRALDWHAMPNPEYWAKYGQPDPSSGNTLAHVLMAAIAKADGKVKSTNVPPSDDTQGNLF